MMGLTPRDVKGMTFAEFAAFFKGFTASKGAADDGPSYEEYLAALTDEMAAGRA